MALFSQRNGHTKVSEAIVREDLTQSLRIRLWNLLKLMLWDGRVGTEAHRRRVQDVIARVWVNLLNEDLDDMPPLTERWSGEVTSYDILKTRFLEGPWYLALDLLEFLIKDEYAPVSKYVGTLNEAFTSEGSAYRIVNSEIVEITSEVEIATIERALAESAPASKIHLERALTLLSDRQTPDYRNSVKESLSAVEAACRVAAGTPSATLAEALRRINGLHPALSKAFSTLYGYGSDESGVRHALTDKGERCTYADAKFMLVACAAFVSYLTDSVK